MAPVTGMAPNRKGSRLGFKRYQMVLGARFREIEPSSGNQIFRRRDRIIGDIAWVQGVREDAIANVDEQNQALCVVDPRNGM